jgi:DNA polymerase-3 subunit gamma/tau
MAAGRDYLPLARKYRPQAFAELIGQPHVTATLTRALEGKRTGQAYLFAGMRGVGKTSAARILAKCLNCERGPGPAPCQRCDNCVQITRGASLDVMEIDGASNRGIDEIRSLRETIGFAPTTGRFRVYIIDEVHMLTAEAFNALLKTLEEPPAHVKFIFATTAPGKVPATVLSRCQRFDFRRIEAAAIVQALARLAKAEGVRLEEPAAFAIARASEGSLRDAEVILEQLASFVDGPIAEAHVTELLGAIGSQALEELARAILDRDAPGALDRLSMELDAGKEPQQLLIDLMRHLRNLLVIRATQDAASPQALRARLIDESPERLTALGTQAADRSPEDLLMCLQVLGSAYEWVRRSALARTILDVLVLKLSTRDSWQSLEQISRRLEELAAGAPHPAAGAPPAPPPAQRPGVFAPRVEGASAPLSARGDAAEPPLERAAKAQPPVDDDALAAQPQPVAEPAAPVALEAVATRWPAFLERLGAHKISLAAYLAESRPLDLAGNVLTIGLPGFALHHEVLAAVETQRVIERLLTEVLGYALTVRYQPMPIGAAPAATAGAAAPPLIQDIVQLFNATVLNPPRPMS